MADEVDFQKALRRTWGAFFARHGGLTETQRQAIPPIVAGENTLVIAGTASGKTEAVIAPLLERQVLGIERSEPALWLLYICPTRALVRDLYERLRRPLQSLSVSLGQKSGDTGPVSISRPPTVLITTPESTDSLLTRAPQLFIPLKAIVLDEIHLFDRSVRGDQLRCLLARIERIRGYERPDFPLLQRVALSATVADPAGVAARYLSEPDIEPVIVEVSGGREVLAEGAAMEGLADLAAAMGARAARKSLVFCNTRNEVEQVAAYLRKHLPYEAPVFVHYSNLDTRLRREIESDFAQAGVAVCVCSSTLELGIDIGSVDDVVLVGPPPTPVSFWQRIGRGGRRTEQMRVLCLFRSPLEEIRFVALLAICGEGLRPGVEPAAYHFRPSVLAQQCFSLLKQSPTGGLRLADLRRVAPAEINDGSLEGLLRHLGMLGYLKKGRPGEWRPGPELDWLVDLHEIYSNIGGEELRGTVIDAYSGRPIGRVDRPRMKGETLLVKGKPAQVAWRDRYLFAVEKGRREDVEESLRFFTPPFAVPVEVAQAAARLVGVAAGQMPFLVDASGYGWLFHFWGDLYGELLAAILDIHYGEHEEDGTGPQLWNEFCLRLPFTLTTLPVYDATLAEQEVRRLAGRLEPYLELGRFHHLLPPEIATKTVLEQCDLARFERLYRATLLVPPDGIRDELLALL